MAYRVIWILALAALFVRDSAHPGDGIHFTKTVEELTNGALGWKEIQEVLDKAKYTDPIKADGDSILSKIAGRIGPMLDKVNGAVNRLRDTVQRVLNAPVLNTTYESCTHATDLTTDPDFPNLEVNTTKLCVAGLPNRLKNLVYPGEILKAVEKNRDDVPHLKWQYFALEKNYALSYPATRVDWPNYEPILRPWYKTTANTVLKDVVIMFDKSLSSQDDLHQRKTAVESVLNTLGPNNRVAVMAFDQEANGPTNCYSEELARAVPPNIRAMQEFVQGVRASVGQSVYSTAFLKAFQYFRNSQSGRERNKIILFISNGRPTDKESLQESEQEIVSVISEQNELLNNEVAVHTLGVGVEKDDDDAEQLLTNIAQEGQYNRANEVESVRPTVMRLFNPRQPEPNTGPQTKAVYAVPYHDGFGFGIVLTGCLPMYKSDDTFLGVACVDMVMRDLIGDLSVLNNLDVGYIFMLNQVGDNIYHPWLPLSKDKDDAAVYAPFSTLEQSSQALPVRDSMLSGGEGKVTLPTKYVIPRGTTQSDGVDHKEKNLTYHWKQITDANFSVCVVLDETVSYREFASTNKLPTQRVLYHRNDKTRDPPDICNWFNRIVFKDKATLQLTPDAFTDPANFHRLINLSEEDLQNIEKCFTGTASEDMHIKAEAMKTVAVLWDALQEIWYKRTGSLSYTKAVYVGMWNGVFINFPGDRNPVNYDHTVRGWFLKAIASPGDYVFVGPYRDASSTLWIVTLAKALTYQGQVLGVAAMDFSMDHLYHHLKEAYPQCATNLFDCMIIDDNAMMILHKDFIEDPDDDPSKMANLHLTDKEPGIAQKLIDRGVTTRSKCFNSKTTQNQNFFKVKIPEDLDDSLEVEDFFELQKIPGTNIFIILRHSGYNDQLQCYCNPNVDESGTPKCKEGIKEENHCECPCHSTARYNYCENQLPTNASVEPPCFPDPIAFPYENLTAIEAPIVATLPSCHNCSDKSTQLSCNAVSCNWCEEKEVCKSQSEPCSVPTVEPAEKEEEGKEGDGFPKVTVILAAVGSLLLLLIVVVIVVMCRRKPNTNESTVNTTVNVHNLMMTKNKFDRRRRHGYGNGSMNMALVEIDKERPPSENSYSEVESIRPVPQVNKQWEAEAADKIVPEPKHGESSTERQLRFEDILQIPGAEIIIKIPERRAEQPAEPPADRVSAPERRVEQPAEPPADRVSAPEGRVEQPAEPPAEEPAVPEPSPKAFFTKMTMYDYNKE